ncbi:MAG: hypothetical protein KGD64_09615 [Candidatus Heimdallarchaeota archaeon]|nr:hypothetical protein [Candidatus Heimdallarchaeota archaeon]
MSNENTGFQDYSSEPKFIRKKPYREINLSEVTKPGKYRIIGTVVNKTDDIFEINDGSGQIEVILTIIPNFEIKEGVVLRLFGFIELEPKRQIKVSVAQNVSNIDMDTYNQIKELEQSLVK